MATQVITQQGYQQALASYYQYCNARGIQPDPVYMNQLAASYGQSYQYPPTEVIQAKTAEEDRAERARQFDIENNRIISQAQKDRDAALADRQMWADAYTEAARIGNQGAMAQAAAQVEAAGIQANAAIEVANIAAQASRYSDDIKAHIADEANELERQRVAAIEFARPSDWAARIGYMRGQTPEQAATLTKYAGGTVFGGQMPGGAALPQPQPATAGAAPAALVGEEGIELAQATPAGVQITPLQQQQAEWLRGRLPEMARGGAISGGYGGGATLPNPTGGARSQLLDPSQMLQSMVSRAKTPEEWLQRRDVGQGFLAGGGAMQAGIQYIPGAGGRLHPWGAGAGQGAALPTAGGTPATPLPATAGAGTTAAGGTPTPAGETSPIDQLPFLVAGRAGGQYNVPSFQEWTGERTFPAMGINKPIPTPWEFNLNQWNNLARAEQAMWAGLWRKAMMIPGETEEEMLANAREAIGRSAFTGMGSALPQYGGW